MERLITSVPQALLVLASVLLIYQVISDNLICAGPNVVHPAHPKHLDFRFEAFVYALCRCHLFDDGFVLLICRRISLTEVFTQLARCQQINTQDAPVVLEILLPSLTTYAEGVFRFVWQGYVRDAVIAHDGICAANFAQIKISDLCPPNIILGSF